MPGKELLLLWARHKATLRYVQAVFAEQHKLCVCHTGCLKLGHA